jgi:hypothetical protein
MIHNNNYRIVSLPISLLYVPMIRYFAIDEIVESRNIAFGQVTSLAN